jgi:hypothetical protein
MFPRGPKRPCRCQNPLHALRRPMTQAGAFLSVFSQHNAARQFVFFRLTKNRERPGSYASHDVKNVDDC